MDLKDLYGMMGQQPRGDDGENEGEALRKMELEEMEKARIKKEKDIAAVKNRIISLS